MSKLILVVALFAAAALASSEIQDNQWWYQYFLKDSSNNWLAFFGAHVEPTATTPGWQTDITHCAYESPAYNGDYRKYVCGDKQSNLEAMLGENTCYVWVYNELGCSGEPAYAWGFVKDKIYTLANVASPYDTTYKFYWDDLSTARYTWVDESNPMIRVQQADSMLAIEFCDSTSCADASRPTMPVGCTDTLYMPGFPFMAHSRPDIYNNDMNSMLVICTEDTGCPRSCYGKTCGTYDDCGEPCIGTCDDGYYCKHSANKYSCETSQYGKITYESFVDYDSYVYAAMAFEGTTPASARYPPSFYTTPTITHLENAFKGDLYWASNKKVPADAIVFQEIAYFTQEIHQIKIKYDINIDAVNSFTNELYSASSLSAYLAKYILNENKVYQGLLGGPFTGAFNLDYYKLSNTVNGTTTSQTTTTESEWVKSVEIKDSWVAHTPEPQQDSAATLVAWMALAVPLVALLL